MVRAAEDVAFAAGEVLLGDPYGLAKDLLRQALVTYRATRVEPYRSHQGHREQDDAQPVHPDSDPRRATQGKTTRPSAPCRQS